MTSSSGPTTVPDRATRLPANIEGVLAEVEEPRRRIYHLVRRILDDLEQVAPWDVLYYPPADEAEFMAFETRLVEVIEAIPGRVGELVDDIAQQQLDEALENMVGDLEFFFHGIHASVDQELDKLVRQLEVLRQEGDDLELSEEDRNFVAELSADLKGKYTSSMMGAASALIADGRWNGVELEPLLFPEKAEEFERNERLVQTLAEVNQNIDNLLQEVPLADLAAAWRERKRVDQYALTPLYSLLGNLGKLMQETSRRALYSGDYHQIQRRENLLSTRVNELATLHNISWGNLPSGHLKDPKAVYPVMIRKAIELAAILDLDILREIVGDKVVNTILDVVTLEKEANPAANRWRGRTDASAVEPHKSRRLVPEELHSLIPLLYNEDLKTFLELLLGSVLKRASLAVSRSTGPQAAPAPEARPEAPPADAAAAPQPPAEETPAEEPAADEPAADEPAADEPAADEPSEDRPAMSPLSVDDLLPTIPEELLGPNAFALPEGEEPPVASAPSPAAPSPAAPSPAAPSPAAEDVPDLAVDDATAAGDAQHAPHPRDADAFEAELEGISGPKFEDHLGFDLGFDLSTGGASREEQIANLHELQRLLDELVTRSNGQRRKFELVHRLLEQGRSIPPAMLESMYPYLFDLMNELSPQLNQDMGAGDLFTTYAAKLIDHCQALCRPDLTPEQLRTEVPGLIEKVLLLLDGLRVAAKTTLDRLQQA